MDENKCAGNLMAVKSKDFFWYAGLFFISVVLFKLLLSIWRGIYSCFLASALGLGVNWKKLGSWAIVTGATDGIGKAYALRLAEKGFNIVLVSRTLEKLNNVSQEIQQKYSVKTIVVAVDFTNESSIYDEIAKNISDLDVGVLVNNVGMSYKYAEYLTNLDNFESFSDNLLKANIVSVTRMTHLVLAQMVSRKRGVIINISSLSALDPVPLLSIYSASKAYVDYFTAASQEEYKKKGIIIQSVLPGFVSTNMSKMRPSLQTCTPDAFAKWALKTVGVEDKTYGYPMHKVQGYVQELMHLYLPKSLNLSINHHMMNKIRLKYYRKFGIKEGKSGEKLLSKKD